MQVNSNDQKLKQIRTTLDDLKSELIQLKHVSKNN